MKRMLFRMLVGALAIGTMFAAGPSLATVVTVNPTNEVGPVKLMNAVNNGFAKRKAE